MEGEGPDGLAVADHPPVMHPCTPTDHRTMPAARPSLTVAAIQLLPEMFASAQQWPSPASRRVKAMLILGRGRKAAGRRQWRQRVPPVATSPSPRASSGWVKTRWLKGIVCV
jgi:hypothetical protein